MRTFTPKVMVISENESTRFFLDFFLNERGYRVNFNRKLIDHMMNTSWDLPDLFIVEHEGGGQCAETCRQLRRRKSHSSRQQDIPILVMAAKEFERDSETLLESGADDVLIRPFRPEQFILRVNNLLYPSPLAYRSEVPACMQVQQYLH
jgi:DNA-binding response OmpR family regulator